MSSFARMRLLFTKRSFEICTKSWYTETGKGGGRLFADCHMHMILDGCFWKDAIGRHREQVDEPFVRATLRRYQARGFTYLRDGGDRWGAGKCARALAPEYGITYRTPLANLCKRGHYGGFIGAYYADFKEYAALVRQHRAAGADFIKIMISGLMDFDVCGRLTEEPLDGDTIRELIHIAHEEGFSVMAHANGARCVEHAACAGVDSVEHGAYLDGDALHAMKENQVVWVPTLSTVGNLRGKGRFDEQAVCAILEGAMNNVAEFGNMGGIIAPGSDAGAWAVPHGSMTEYQLLTEALGSQADTMLEQGVREIQKRF